MPYSDPMTDESRDSLREGLFLETVRLIDRQWPAVDAVARALLERRTLSQADVWSIAAPTVVF
jgi:hypothetical protein